MTAGVVALFQMCLEILMIYVAFLLLNAIPFERIVVKENYAQLLKIFIAIALGYLVSLFFIAFIEQVQALQGLVK